ncbi:flavodoxin family protein [Gorillibacterium sp. sgz500922]|uniref:flavodoxin family protein n=1 Tax=Gorillibacterium sp. sgz500922 TaxID=3446694 RepID=UPI003F67845F
MKLIVHDLAITDTAPWLGDLPADAEVIANTGGIRACTGCFGCWVRTPGRCVLKDGYQHMGEKLAACDELVIVSRCVYGSYSPFVRNILDRSISYVLPYFVSRNGETHHRNRYDHRFKLSVHFYGDDLTEAERTTARRLVEANAVNLYADVAQIEFHETAQAAGEGWQ